MPLVRISLLKGKSQAYVRAIADGVHQALVETYNVPAADRFQFIDQYEPDHLIYDADYFGIHRSDDVVFIRIAAGRWRDTPTKQRLYARLAEILSDKPGLRPEDVQVSLSPNDRDDWSFGLGLASYVETAKPA